jgi:hypothetical protein
MAVSPLKHFSGTRSNLGSSGPSLEKLFQSNIAVSPFEHLSGMCSNLGSTGSSLEKLFNNV